MDWTNMYIVLQDTSQKLYIYEKRGDLQPKDVLDLKSWQAHGLDDSFFKRPFCFQIVLLPTGYDVITQKNKDKVQTINFSAASRSEKADWLQDLSITCICCSKCTRYHYDVMDDGSDPNASGSLHGSVPSSPIRADGDLKSLEPLIIGTALIPNKIDSSQSRMFPPPSPNVDYLGRLPTTSSRSSVATNNKSRKSAIRISNRIKSAGLNVIKDADIQPRRSLTLSLYGFRDLNFGFDLGFGSLTQASAFYALVFTDNVKIAKTEIATLESKKWEEHFYFDFIPPCHQNIRM